MRETRTLVIQPRAKKAKGHQLSKKAHLTRERILDAAANQCTQRGYSLTKLSDIAHEAGIHLSALYYYFDTKESLFTELLAQVPAQASRALHSVLDELSESTSPLRRLEIAIHIYLSNILRTDQQGRALINVTRHAPLRIQDRAREISQKENATFQQLLEDAYAAGHLRHDLDITLARMILLGAMNWSIEWFREGPKTVEDLSHHVTQILFHGLAIR